MPPVRAFVAVEVSPEVRERATKLIGSLRLSPAKARWVEPQNLHFTLKFLGNVNFDETPDVFEALEEAVADLPVFDVLVRGVGAFPDARRPRTVWLGAGEGSEEFVALHDRIEVALAPLGFRREQRRYRPHITLGRIRSIPEDGSPLEKLIEENREFEAGMMTVFNVQVFSSELGRMGPVYQSLGAAQLTE